MYKLYNNSEPCWKLILKFIERIFLGIIILLAICLLALSIPQPKYHYEYVDMDDNKGIAKECSYYFTEAGRGGQGSPVCKLEDGTVKQVKEYKYIYEGEYKPIDEVWED